MKNITFISDTHTKHDELKHYIKKEKINNKSKWNQLILPKNRPVFIPTNPDKTYKNKGWTNWDDFFNL